MQIVNIIRHKEKPHWNVYLYFTYFILKFIGMWL